MQLILLGVSEWEWALREISHEYCRVPLEFTITNDLN